MNASTGEPPRFQTAVFAGPSLHGRVTRLGGRAILLPPIKRGDMESLPRSVDRVLIIDGCLGQELAVSLSEILTIMSSGIRVYGCSSMGALRAVELAGHGMIGLGWIYDQLLGGKLDGESDLVLSYGCHFAPCTVPLVNVKHWLRRNALLCESGAADRIVRSIQRIHFHERSYEVTASLVARELPSQAKVPSREDLLCGVKRDDAIFALQTLQIPVIM